MAALNCKVMSILWVLLPGHGHGGEWHGSPGNLILSVRDYFSQNHAAVFALKFHHAVRSRLLRYPHIARTIFQPVMHGAERAGRGGHRLAADFFRQLPDVDRKSTR